MAEFVTIDEYIASFPTDVQPALESIRETIHNTVPGLDETISYQMPTMTVNGKNLIHFAGWKNHISMYPLPAGDAEFEVRRPLPGCEINREVPAEQTDPSRSRGSDRRIARAAPLTSVLVGAL
ncbi:iron chaperone [Rhodococcus sp. 3Y1]